MHITNLSIQENTVKFTVKTNGERGLVNVNLPGNPDLEILDLNSRTLIPWTHSLDNSIVLYVESDHEYEIRNVLKT
jgi:hypothetical protein